MPHQSDVNNNDSKSFKYLLNIFNKFGFQLTLRNWLYMLSLPYSHSQPCMYDYLLSHFATVSVTYSIQMLQSQFRGYNPYFSGISLCFTVAMTSHVFIQVKATSKSTNTRVVVVDLSLCTLQVKSPPPSPLSLHPQPTAFTKAPFIPQNSCKGNHHHHQQSSNRAQNSTAAAHLKLCQGSHKPWKRHTIAHHPSPLYEPAIPTPL